MRRRAAYAFWRVANPLVIQLAGKWVRNLEHEPMARMKHRGRWRDVIASIEPMDPAVRRRFNLYARSGTGITGIEPCLIRLDPA